MGSDGKDIGRRVGEVVGDAVGGVLSTAVRGVGQVGHVLAGAFRLPGLNPGTTHAPSAPGDIPGIESFAGVEHPPTPEQVRITCTDYSEAQIERRELTLDALDPLAIPEWAGVRWLRIQGLHPYVINHLRGQLDFHTLTAEDLLRPSQRPRTEAYDDHLFIVTQLFKGLEGQLQSEQIGMLLYDRLLVTFQESHEPLWSALEHRMTRTGSRIRRADASYLAYAMLDIVVDHSFPLLEGYAVQLEALEDAAMDAQGSDLLQQVHRVKRDLAVLRRVLWPVRELITELRKLDHAPLVSDATRAFLSDVQEHCAQLVDMTETFRDLAGSITDLHISMNSHRMNETMQVLTVISTIFIPIGFLAGVFGMNFRVLPGLEWEYGYLGFWGACISVSGGLLWYFKRRGWFG